MNKRNGRSPKSATALPEEKDGSKDRSESEWKKILTANQYAVLRKKATDVRHLTVDKGGLDDLYDAGHYSCAGCGTKLYESEMKFDCGCGWPGFWTNISKAVREEPDEDGRRVELVCNSCNGHLGHIFRHEGFRNPEPNERHCINSTALKFTPRDGAKATAALAPKSKSAPCSSG